MMKKVNDINQLCICSTLFLPQILVFEQPPGQKSQPIQQSSWNCQILLLPLDCDLHGSENSVQIH